MKITKIVPILLAGSLLTFAAGCSTTPSGEDSMAAKDAMEQERDARIQAEQKARLAELQAMQAKEQAKLAQQEASRARLAEIQAANEAEQAKRLFQNKLNK
ncbi:MAG: hypothetical protein HQL72_15595 [Magnetococcales bacterium]|nr:hypothetical protein [Magnetococcales bacterium]